MPNSWLSSRSQAIPSGVATQPKEQEVTGKVSRQNNISSMPGRGPGPGGEWNTYSHAVGTLIEWTDERELPLVERRRRELEPCAVWAHRTNGQPRYRQIAYRARGIVASGRASGGQLELT